MTTSSSQLRALPQPFRIVDAFALSDVGLVREYNEDAAISSVSRGVFVVADGMGGLPAGVSRRRRSWAD